MSTASAVPSAMTYPWLRPAAASLLALTDDSPEAGSLRDDPGLILHVLRYSRPTPEPMSFSLDEATLCQPGLCETAAKLLEFPDGGSRNRGAEITGQRIAHLAVKLAAETELCSSDAAWAAGLLAPLGLYLGDTDNPLSLARRLLARWRLPVWFQVAVGYLDLPIEETQALGGHRGVNRILRAAIRQVGFRLFADSSRESDVDLDPLAASFAENPPPFRELPHDPNPALLTRLLKVAGRARVRTAQTWMLPLEERLDALVGKLAEARHDFDRQLRDAKLESLAEFAAGASHEINNPLAVISGNAQWLQGRETDPDKVQYLQTILRQTRRIHDLLTGSRQFSRPSPAKPTPLFTQSILTRLQRDFEPEAERLEVRFEVATSSDSSLHVDGEQIRTALGHLMRNAVEAAGQGGWVKLSSTAQLGTVEFQIEDSGPGPAAGAEDHLFDPFFSGREAGRGRGLGLSIAWALARNNGGDIRWAGREADCTRFTLSLPKAIPLEEAPTRQVA